MTTTAHVVAQWDALISSVLTRFDQVLAEATHASEPLVAAAELGPLAQAWSAIEHRLRTHAEEISDGWESTSDALSNASDLAEETMMREGSKRDAATIELEIRYTRSHRNVMARAAELMRRSALTTDATDHGCTQCGAPLAKAAPVSQSLNVACASCGAVNTVNPSNALRMFAASGAHFLAEHAALVDWEAMKRTEHQIDQYRDKRAVPLALLSDFEGASRRYWETRLGIEAQLVPEHRPHVAMKLERYLKDTHKKLRQFWQWRQKTA